MSGDEWTIEMRSTPIPGIGGGYAHSYIVIIDGSGVERLLFEGHGIARNGPDEPAGWEHFIPFYDDRIDARGSPLIENGDLRGGNREVIYRGSGNVVWGMMVPALALTAEAITNSDVSYEPITINPFEEGQNSNSVVRAFTDVIQAISDRGGGEYNGVPDYYTDDEVLWHKNNSVYLPGWHRNLLDQIDVDVPELIERTIRPSLPEPVQEIEVRPLPPLDGQPGAARDLPASDGQRADGRSDPSSTDFSVNPTASAKFSASPATIASKAGSGLVAATTATGNNVEKSAANRRLGRGAEPAT